MQKNEQLELAYNFVQYTDKNVFLTGKAGTGKTTFLHNLKQSTLKRMAIVAPTGVAAINAGGVTIHSFFQMPFGPYLAESLGVKNNENAAGRQRKFNRDKINLLQSLDLLVIDEISMVRADMLDGIDEVLRRYKNRLKPFGGVQLLMIGDLHQLSPVVKDDDWKILRDFYPNLYFFSSRALQQSMPVCIELKHIYRQSDSFFIDLLNRVRENRIDTDVLQNLNQRYLPGFNPADNEGYITLTTHNYSAQEINEKKLHEITTKAHSFSATVKGDFPEYSYPTVLELIVKTGAQVMFVKNDPSREKLFYNGKIGKITRIDEDKIFVKCPGDTWEIEVTPAEWENIKYELNTESKEVEEKSIGNFIQYPIKLAWAITIHKSQGLTFEKAIIDAGASFAHGQVYVALSRCKSFEGMVLRSPIALNSVKTDGTISTYTKEAEENAPGEEHLTESKIAFQQSLLYELFDFKIIKSRFFYLTKLTQENESILPANINTDLNILKENLEKGTYTVADTFSREMGRLLTDTKLPEENSVLQERVQKACSYFTGKLEDVISAFRQISFETDNKAVAKTIRDAAEKLNKDLSIKLIALKDSSAGFNTIQYLKTKANAEIDHMQALASEKPVTATAPKSVTHLELYMQLKKWRDELAREHNVPVYMVLPSKVLTDLVSILPSNLRELETVKGFGKQKVRQYGKEILEMISAFCDNNGIDRGTIELKSIPERLKADTKRVSLDLFVAGKTITEIALERNLTSGTIETHLAHFVSTGELDIHQLISKEKVERIEKFAQENKIASLTELKVAMGDDYSYNEIRLILKYFKMNLTEQ